MWKRRFKLKKVITWYLVIGLLAILTPSVWADLPIQTLSVGSSSSVPLGFNPDNYNFLIYDCGTTGASSDLTDIVAAMKELFGENKYLGENFTYRSSSNPVTAYDLNNNDILIVGWNSGGNTSGLTNTIIDYGITGRVLLSGHDADYHTVKAAGNHDDGAFQPADIFFSQAIEYVLNGSGTGLIALGDSQGFQWIPTTWGVVTDVVSGGGEEVSDFTTEAYNSGVYDGLEPEHMSNWVQSYHNSFDVVNTSDSFSPFEIKYISDTTDIEYAITIAADINPYEQLELSKEDLIIDNDGTGTDCCDPDDDIEYTICWSNVSNRIFDDVTIVDVLPYGVDYDFAVDPFNPDPNYDILNHTYTWHIGTIDPNIITGCVSLTVTVNEHAEAGMFLHNEAYIYNGDVLIGVATADTPVCCWETEDADLILVDKNATGFNTGTSWEHAYTDLQKALTRAREAVCSASGYKIYVAEGRYSPGNFIMNDFELPYGTEMYGGFKRGGCAFEDRNPDKYITVLNGKINDTTLNNTIVSMGDDCILDGFVVENANVYVVYGENADCEVNNCQILKSQQYGLFFENGNVNLNWNKVRYNEKNGIHHMGVEKNIVISHCFSSFNGENGIFADNSSLTLKNSVITKNGDESSYGIRIIDPNEPPVLYHNTIAYNYNMGISYIQSDPNASEPDVNGCILYYNNDDNEQMYGIEYTEYCCIQDSVNDPNGLNYLDPDYFYNITGKPMFAYLGDPNNIHLAHDSLLIDRGDSDLTSAEIGSVDIDNEARIDDYWLDIGADEVNTCDSDLSEDDIYNVRDWNNDGIVNLKEFSLMSAAWLTNSPDTPGYVADPNNYDPNFVDNWNETCNLYVDYTIDIQDFELFTDEWLWTACWKDSLDSRFDNIAAPLGGETMMMAPMSMPLESTVSLASVEEVSIDEQAERENLAMLVLGIYQIMDLMEESKYNATSELAIDDVDAEIEKLEEILWEMYDDYYSIDKKTKKYKTK